MHDVIEALMAEIANEGMTPPKTIRPAEYMRFPGAGKKPGNKAGWCFLYPDFLGAQIGDFSRDTCRVWWAKSKDDFIFNRAEIEANRKQREIEVEARRAKAAKVAFGIWSSAKPADPEHPYLRTKQIVPTTIVKQRGDELILPVIDFDEKFHSLQFVSPGGSKRMLSGGRTKGCFIPVSWPPHSSQVSITEGFSTGAYIAKQCPNDFVLAAISANNLLSVGSNVRHTFPTKSIKIFGDDDRQTAGNPGRTKAIEVAEKVSNVQVCFPNWPDNAPSSLTDFLDLHLWRKGELA